MGRAAIPNCCYFSVLFLCNQSRCEIQHTVIREYWKPTFTMPHIKSWNPMLRLNCKIFSHNCKGKHKNNLWFPTFEGTYFWLLRTPSSWTWSRTLSHPSSSVPAPYPNKAPTFGDWSTPPHLASLSAMCRGSHEHISRNLGNTKCFWGLHSCRGCQSRSCDTLCLRQQWYLTGRCTPGPQSLEELWCF